MAALNNIEILVLVGAWFALNLSMIRDWMAERRGKTPEAGA
jgi:hypothetical protein